LKLTISCLSSLPIASSPLEEPLGLGEVLAMELSTET
jgi:hypothetical protein